ncbi:MAG: hypothetical protein AVDCRST_MAG05-3045, partial [uncultured Rubrobacteraceae bacterium]
GPPGGRRELAADRAQSGSGALAGCSHHPGHL